MGDAVKHLLEPAVFIGLLAGLVSFASYGAPTCQAPDLPPEISVVCASYGVPGHAYRTLDCVTRRGEHLTLLAPVEPDGGV